MENQQTSCQIAPTSTRQSRSSLAWSPEDVLAFTRMWNSGDTLPAMARALGRTMKACSRMRPRLGLPARRVAPPPGARWSTEALDRLVELWGSGLSSKRIAHELSLTVSQVNNMRRYLDLPLRRRRGRGARDQVIQILVSEDQRDALNRLSHASGMERGTYLRRLVESHLAEVNARRSPPDQENHNDQNSGQRGEPEHAGAA